MHALPICLLVGVADHEVRAHARLKRPSVPFMERKRVCRQWSGNSTDKSKIRPLTMIESCLDALIGGNKARNDVLDGPQEPAAYAAAVPTDQCACVDAEMTLE